MRRIITIIAALALSASVFAQADSVAIEALSRLKGMDLEANPALKGAVLKVLEKTKDTPQFVEIVRDFNLKGQSKELVDFASKNPTNSTAVEGLRLALKEAGPSAIQPISIGLVQAMGNSGDKEFVPVIAPIVEDAKQPADLRKAAVKALAQSELGATHLLSLAKDEKLDQSLKFTATTALHSAQWPKIKAEAAQALPLPQTNAAPLPPVADLVKAKGDPANGAKVFRKPEVNCIGCHKVNNEGVDFGPALSEIGTKLAKEAIYESILDPSSGISFGFEGWQLELKDGDEVTGIVASESADEIVLKSQTGISTKYKKSDVPKRTKSTLSLMPAGLQQAMSQQDLVDLVEYLSTLKKKP
ncbi:MAG TPA: c-type cytochrome [Verrucomicrobiae bacterium]|nr:c-type cytochrome [Verrucomicrobiae bacterium]